MIAFFLNKYYENIFKKMSDSNSIINNKIEFRFGTVEIYNSLLEKNAIVDNSFYFLDSGQLYLGKKLYSTSYKVVTSWP